MSGLDYPVVQTWGWQADDPFVTRITFVPKEDENVQIGSGFYRMNTWNRDALLEAIKQGMKSPVQHPLAAALSLPKPTKVLKARRDAPTISSVTQNRFDNAKSGRLEIYWSVFGLVISSEALGLRMPLRRFLRALDKAESLRVTDG